MKIRRMVYEISFADWRLTLKTELHKPLEVKSRAYVHRLYNTDRFLLFYFHIADKRNSIQRKLAPVVSVCFPNSQEGFVFHQTTNKFQLHPI